jgi:hypothetical protein
MEVPPASNRLDAICCHRRRRSDFGWPGGTAVRPETRIMCIWDLTHIRSVWPQVTLTDVGLPPSQWRSNWSA